MPTWIPSHFRPNLCSRFGSDNHRSTPSFAQRLAASAELTIPHLRSTALPLPPSHLAPFSSSAYRPAFRSSRLTAGVEQIQRYTITIERQCRHAGARHLPYLAAQELSACSAESFAVNASFRESRWSPDLGCLSTDSASKKKLSHAPLASRRSS